MTKWRGPFRPSTGAAVEGKPGKKSDVRILVVDDDEDIRRIVTDTIEKMGYGVVAVASGEEAIRAVASQRFCLALVDMKMPDIGAQEAIMKMREHDPQMRIIVVASSPHPQMEALQATTQGWLYKPFRLEELRSVIERVLGAPSQEEPSALADTPTPEG